MNKFNYTNPNSSILEAFVDEWPDAVEDIEVDEVEPYTDVYEDNLEECDKVQITEAKEDEEVAEEETPVEEEPDTSELAISDEEVVDANEPVENPEDENTQDVESETEVEAEEEAKPEEVDNISADDFLAQIKDLLDANKNDLEAEDIDEAEIEKLTAFNDGLAKAYELVQGFFETDEDEENEEEAEEEAEEVAAEAEAPIETEVVAEPAAEVEVIPAAEIKLELAED